MKLLERKDPWKKVALCLGCKSKLLIEKDDILYMPPSAVGIIYGIEHSSLFHFKCVVCGRDNVLDQVPAYVQKSIVQGFSTI